MPAMHDHAIQALSQRAAACWLAGLLCHAAPILRARFQLLLRLSKASPLIILRCSDHSHVCSAAAQEAPPAAQVPDDEVRGNAV